MAKKFAYLVMTTEENNNKFYSMTIAEGSSTINVEYGRVQKTSIKETYPESMWDKKFKEKIKKGYKDVTDLYTEIEAIPTANGTQKTAAEIQDLVVRRLFDELQAYANKSIQQNYTVTQTNVSQKMVDAAQEALNSLSNALKVGASKDTLNKSLLELYTIIPPQMANVKNHLFSEDITKANLGKAKDMLAEEQATLDVMAGQVEIYNKQKEANKSAEDKGSTTTITLLEQLGLEVSEVTDGKTLDMIKTKMQENARKVGKVYSLINKKTQAIFDKHLATKNNKTTTLLFHGSRNPNWLSIIEKGLLIRPAGAGYSGSMFADGIYGALESAKSLNYTGSAYATNSYVGGNEPKVFLALFEFHTGKQLDIYQHDSSCYTIDKKVKAEGYDCVWAHKGPSLFRDEIIVYNSAQVTIKYLIEVK